MLLLPPYARTSAACALAGCALAGCALAGCALAGFSLAGCCSGASREGCCSGPDHSTGSALKLLVLATGAEASAGLTAISVEGDCSLLLSVSLGATLVASSACVVPSVEEAVSTSVPCWAPSSSCT